MPLDIAHLKPKVSDRLNLYLRELKETNLEQTDELTINSDEYRTSEQVSNLLTRVSNPQTPVIYKLTIESDSERKGLIKTYEQFHSENRLKDRGKDRLNVSRFNNTNSNTLYLGSKMKNPHSRIKQHLGDGYFRTFSLHLNKWDVGLNYELTLQIFKITSKISQEYQRNLVELLEQELWDEYKPIFGKKSGL